jgi:hypothetical protein
MADEEYVMVEECTDSYRVQPQDDGGVEIRIRIPRRFADLWVAKLSDLKVTDAEIREYEP